MPLVLPPEWSLRLPSERGTRPPPGLATENDLYDNNRSVSFGFVGFCSVSFSFVRFRSVSFGFVEKGNPHGPSEIGARSDVQVSPYSLAAGIAETPAQLELSSSSSSRQPPIAATETAAAQAHSVVNRCNIH